MQIKSWRLRWAEHVARIGEERKVYKALVGKPEEKISLRRTRRGWEDGIKKDLREIGCGVWSGFNWLSIGTGSELL
jgi:hypothetical protein